jgi:hypothetical protein
MSTGAETEEEVPDDMDWEAVAAYSQEEWEDHQEWLKAQ